MSGYAAMGKQVLHGRDHIADARDNETADMIADALNLWCADDPCPVMPEIASRHIITRVADQYLCSCGKQWDADEGDEHP